MAGTAFTVLGLCLTLLCLLNFIFVFGTGVEFIRFISLQAIFYNISGAVQQPKGDDANREWNIILRDPRVLRPLAVDLGLIIVFILQHSLMATSTIKRWITGIFGVLQRSLYVFSTSVVLQVIMRYWQPVRDAPLIWSASTVPWNTWIPLICFVLHFFAWLIIFTIILIFDYAELMGVKQIYYYCLGLEDPLSMKSLRAQRLYSHLRHPVYLEFLLILWAVPCLSLDRVLLATLFTLYLTCGHSLDEQDYRYLRVQLDRKLEIFSREEITYGQLLAANGSRSENADKEQ
ncbi:nurim [Protopterus annectens]|uniref:nurim n=1 Tax=Protopterus annectens TaxID=7888 RepID=UPI001CFA5F46|nr:nurim [Protopterus annectens]